MRGDGSVDLVTPRSQSVKSTCIKHIISLFVISQQHRFLVLPYVSQLSILTVWVYTVHKLIQFGWREDRMDKNASFYPSSDTADLSVRKSSSGKDEG